jgi:hypothetical protein
LVPYVALRAMIFLDLCIRIPSAFIGFLSNAKFLVVSIIAQSYMINNFRNLSKKKLENKLKMKILSYKENLQNKKFIKK